MAGNIVYGGKNIALEQSQFNNSSTLKDSSTVEVSSRAENEVEENLFTLGNKWVTKDRNKWKCKRSNIEKMKLNRTRISEDGDGKSDIVKNNLVSFSSTLNLNFC